MKSKWLDSLLAAVNSKDEAGIKNALAKVLDEEREEEEKKRKEEEEAKDKARDERTEKIVKDCIAAAFKARDEEEKKREDEKEAERKKSEDAEEEKRKKEEDEDIEEEIEEESGTKDARKAKDSALLVDSFEAVKSLAEIVSPGIAIPTLDQAAEPKKTFRDCHCSLRRKTIASALADPATAELITAVRGRVLDAADLDKLTPAEVRTLFNGVAALKRSANNAAVTRDGGSAVRVAANAADTRTATQKFIDAAKERKKAIVGSK